MSDYPEVVYWLALINESGLKLNLIKPIIQRWCVAEQRPLSALFGLSAREWSTTFGLADREAGQAASTQDKLVTQAAALARWQAAEVEPLILTDPRFPKRLLWGLPPAQQPLVLWAQGEIDLLNEATVAMLGEEAPDEATAQFLDELMQGLVSDDMGLVSGYGRGLDRSAFEMMLQTEGSRAVVMLPMGLNAFAKTTSKLEEVAKAGRIVLASPFAPDTPYEERLADARNLLIDQLALALLILHTSDEARERAETALSRGQPVFVRMTDTANNRALIEQGALLLTDAGEVVEMVQQALIDAALQAPNAEEEEPVLPVPLPTEPPILADSDDDYGLRFEEIEPIDNEEALEILSLGGEIPEMLRQRLEERADDEEDE